MTLETRFLDQLKKTLATLPSPYFLALSGGMDSMVLLEGLFRVQAQITAIHIHHGLQQPADDWLVFCQQQTAQRGFEFEARKVQLAKGGNIEAKARQARYAEFEQLVGVGTLLTAQHQDDDAETLLLGLARGAGVLGLGGMPSVRQHGLMTLARPMLHISRRQVEQLAVGWQLEWVNDPSNQDNRFERNWLRNTLLPLWQARQPNIKQQITQSAHYLLQAGELVDELANLDLSAVCHVEGGIDLSLLSRLSEARQHNVLRFWLSDKEPYRPGLEWISHLYANVINTANDAQPKLPLEQGVVTRYRERLVWLPNAVFDLPQNGTWKLRQVWNSNQLVVLSGLLDPTSCCATLQHLQTLCDFVQNDNENLKNSDFYGGKLKISAGANELSIRFAKGGETLLLRGIHQKVSECWRVVGVPAWLRAWLPLFYANDELVAVAGIGTADNWLTENPTAIAWLLPARFLGS